MKRARLILIVGLLFVVASLPAAVFAETTRADNRAIKKAEKLLAKVEKLQARLKTFLSTASPEAAAAIADNEDDDSDNDGDGLSDDLEDALDFDECDADTDDDGAEDDDEFEDRTNPHDPADGNPDVEGAIVALSDTSITVGSTTCALTANTKYERNDLPSDRSAFSVGELIELECTTDGIALEVEVD